MGSGQGLENCANALRRTIPPLASEESIALFKQYQAMQNSLPRQNAGTSDPMENMFDECRAIGDTKRLSVKPSKHYESVKAFNNIKEEVLICTLSTSHRCKGFASSKRK